MWGFLIKAGLTAAFIVAMSELAKRSMYVSALLIALPLTTAITTVWLYLDTHDAHRAANYAGSVLLLVPPGLLFLAVLPLCVRAGLDFWLSLIISIAVTGLVYFAYAWVLRNVWSVSL